MSFDPDFIEQAVSRYRRERDRYVKLADRVAEICRDDVCEQNAIRAQVTWRAKSEKSFEGKLRRFSSQPDRSYTSVDEIFAKISDLAGVRISAYQDADCERIIERLSRAFRGPGDDSEIVADRKDKKTPENKNYYRAIHVQAALPEDQLVGTYDNVSDISCEIQVCTMMAHVWNEIEHDIGYKPDRGKPSPDESYYLDQLGMLVRQGDLAISALVAAHDQRLADAARELANGDPARPFVDVHDFVSRMRDFSDTAMPNFAENSGQLFELFMDLGINSPQETLSRFAGFDPASTRKELDRFNKILQESHVEGLHLDPDTSDLLLVGLLERENDKVREALKGRAGRGKGRPSRLHRISVRYLSSK